MVSLKNMSRKVKILLRWLVPSGKLPRGQEFSVPARFDHQGEDWTSNGWSLTITTEGVPDAEGRQIGTARFLMSEAPHDWLSVGKRFMIFSSKALAQGLVEQVLSD